MYRWVCDIFLWVLPCSWWLQVAVLLILNRRIGMCPAAAAVLYAKLVIAKHWQAHKQRCFGKYNKRNTLTCTVCHSLDFKGSWKLRSAMHNPAILPHHSWKSKTSVTPMGVDVLGDSKKKEWKPGPDYEKVVQGWQRCNTAFNCDFSRFKYLWGLISLGYAEKSLWFIHC